MITLILIFLAVFTLLYFYWDPKDNIGEKGFNDNLWE